MHYYSFNIKTYRSDTSHLTDAEDLTYRRLIDHYYDTESPIPNANPLLYRRLRIDENVAKIILQEFFQETENGWVHGYIDAEIVKYKNFIDKQKANGSKGGRGKGQGKKPTANPNKPTANPTLSQPITNNQEPNIFITDVINNKASPKFSAIDYLKSHGVDEGVANDWLQLRKHHKAPATKTAINSIIKESSKAGMDLERTLATCCARGWRGFKAEWLSNHSEAQTKPAKTQHQLNQEATLRAIGIGGDMFGKMESKNLIEGDIL